MWISTNNLALTPPQYNIDHNVPGYRDSGTDHYSSLIKHLEGLEGNAILGHQSGGGWCWRYSCAYNIGVYACNDNESHDVEVPWSFIVEYAGHVHDYCILQRRIHGTLTERILGQAFHPDGWNVIVGISNDKGC